MVHFFSLFVIFISLFFPVYGVQELSEQSEQLREPQLFQSDVLSIYLPPGMMYRKVPGLYIHMQTSEQHLEVWPVLDPALNLLTMGITLVQEKAGKKIDDLVLSHMKLYTNQEDRYFVVERPRVSQLTLHNGLKGRLINQVYLQSDRDQKSIKWIGKLFVESPNNKIWILTAFIKCSQQGWKSLSYERLPWFLVEHFKTLTFSQKGHVDSQQKLLKSYKSFNWNLKQSVREAMVAKRLAKLKDTQKAVSHFEKALALSEYQTFSYHGLAWVLMDMGHDDWQRIEKLAKRAVDLSDHRSPDALHTLSLVKEKRGQLKEALDLVDQILVLNPANSDKIKERRSKLTSQLH